MIFFFRSSGNKTFIENLHYFRMGENIESYVFFKFLAELKTVFGEKLGIKKLIPVLLANEMVEPITS